MIAVGVVGACGRMGRVVCRAVAEQQDMRFVAAVDRSHVGESVGKMVGDPALDLVVSGALDALLGSGAEVAVDFTHPDVVRDNIRWAVSHGLHVVVGTTGLTVDDHDDIAKQLAAEGSRSNVVACSNFAVGAALMQRFAALGARYLPAAEVIELHHEGKADAPSGTAMATARRIAAARDGRSGEVASRETVAGARGGEVEGIRVHSVRLPGLVAHQEVILGGLGQTLTIRHDSTDRTSFVPGVLLAVREVAGRPGLTVGLDTLLGFPEDT